MSDPRTELIKTIKQEASEWKRKYEELQVARKTASPLGKRARTDTENNVVFSPKLGITSIYMSFLFFTTHSSAAMSPSSKLLNVAAMTRSPLASRTNTLHRGTPNSKQGTPKRVRDAVTTILFFCFSIVC